MSTFSALVLAESSLQSYWRLGEAAGSTTAADEKRAVAGTYSGGPTLGQPSLLTGDANSSVRFAASGQAVDLGQNYKFLNASPFSVEVWASLVESLAQANKFLGNVANPGTGTAGWQLFANTPHQPRFDRWVANAATSCVGPTALAAGRHQFFGTYDGTNMVLYLDGLAVATNTDTRLLTDSGAALTIGANPDGPTFSSGADGWLEEVAIYNAAIAPASVNKHYLAGIGTPLFPVETAMIGLGM